jgi:hypothetical protein
MNGRRTVLGLLALLSMLVTGCAVAPTGTSASESGPTPPVMSMPPGMVMSPGMSMSGMTQNHSGPITGPSASATMVCGSEIRSDVVAILALPTAPATTATWVDHLYTCTYHLPDGPLVLSVKESGDVPAANTYFTALRRQLGPTRPLTGLAGLGSPGYDTSSGRVVVRKDDKTLQVDASGLPATLGQHHQSRVDLAYEVTSDVLGCWNGN